MMHQTAHRISGGGRQSQPAGHALGNGCAHRRVLAAAERLAGVVQQERQIQKLRLFESLK
ncbi:MAG: hypothetical protein BWX84_00713 [Verrucomicrobia bacterium ADurb.Bin118]|nr:MAG: hypothetical protein BWX84_00713 [Verrucomicrobia bacterium ADurb.Bin118]